MYFNVNDLTNADDTPDDLIQEPQPKDLSLNTPHHTLHPSS